MRSFKIAAALMLGASLAACSTMGDDMGAEASASTRSMVTVGGAPMYANRISSKRRQSPDNKKWSPLEAADLGDTRRRGPFTVFARPTRFRPRAASTGRCCSGREQGDAQSVLTIPRPGRLRSDLGQIIRMGAGQTPQTPRRKLTAG